MRLMLAATLVALACGPLRAADAPAQLLHEWPVDSTRLPDKVQSWHNADAAADAVAEPETPFPGGKGAMVVRVSKSAGTQPAAIQLNFLAHEAIGTGGVYGFSLWVKASQPATCEAGAILDDAPYSGLSAERSTRLQATAEWQPVRVVFTATREVSDEAAIRAPYLGLGLAPVGTTLWIAGATFFEVTPPPPPVPLRLSPQLLHNADFANGLDGWTAQAAEIAPDAGACRVTKRTERWGTPVQDVRAALEANGAGFYEFGAAVRPVQGRGTTFAVLHFRDATGDHWLTTDTRAMQDAGFTRVSAHRLVVWSGQLTAADLGVQSGAGDMQDLLVDDMSLRAMENLTRGRPVTTAGENAALACDGRLDTHWQAAGTEASLEVDLGRTVAFNTCVLSEQGNNVSAYTLEAWQDGQWRACLSAGEIMGLADELHFAPVSASRVRLHITRSLAPPAINELALYTTNLRRQTARVPAPPADATRRGARTLVGAIRWDGWCGDLSPVGLGLEAAMGPEKYHTRLPFYAQVQGPGQVQIRCTTQEIMDREIAFAKEAGIDYWAFDWYAGSDGLATARKLYLSSAHRNDVKWCVIGGTGSLSEEERRWLVGQFRTENYQKVLGDRPLVYVFNADTRSGVFVKALREDAAAAGCPEPFVVAMGWGPEVASAAAAIGADAIGAYVNPVGSGKDFAANMAHDRSKWDALLRTGRQVVPTVTTGWDPRPFLDYPVPWYPGAKPDNWVGPATPEQIAEQLRACLDFVKAHPDATLANAALIYAWNENAEGGWIVPTRAEMQGGIPRRLDAIRGVSRPEVPVGSGWEKLTQ